MSLKHLINFKKILEKSNPSYELTLPGEPMIYSVKCQVGKRHLHARVFRNRQFFSIIRCYFRAQTHKSKPVVIIVKFFVSPPEKIKIPDSELKKEKTPAVYSYEIAEYILSFMELMLCCLIGSYRQIVKVDAEKFYSNNPRTVFRFYAWDTYVALKNHHTVHPPAEGFATIVERPQVQPNSPGNGRNKEVCGPSP